MESGKEEVGLEVRVRKGFKESAEDLKLNESEKKLYDFLVEVNGQDAYSNLTAGTPVVTRAQAMYLPIGISIPNVDAKDVGSDSVYELFSLVDLANVFLANREHAPDGVDADLWGLARMEMFKLGWVFNQKGIVFVEEPKANGKVITLLTAIEKHRDRLAELRRVCFVQPLIAEIIFRTMGHHFLSSDASTFIDKYNNLYAACLIGSSSNMFRPDVLFYDLAHWVGPKRARAVVKAQIEKETVPDAVKIRVNSAPAGMAVATTTAEIFKTMNAGSMLDDFCEASGVKLKGFFEAVEKVVSHPEKFHKASFAYEAEPLTAEEKEMVEAMKSLAIRYAPVTQAYVDTFFRRLALGQAKALRKHADQNPTLYKRATTLFKTIGFGEVTSFKSLFESPKITS